jgi:uncharacterized protein
MITTIILPGIGNSGPDHWQTHWERLNPSFRRIQQDEWDAPRCEDWVKRLDAVISSLSDKIVLVAHSSSCALVAHWTLQANTANIAKIHGALLVGPSDPTGPNYPAGPTGFAPVPLIRLPFPSIVVASTDDRYVTIERAREYAAAWHSRTVVIENAGHINSTSGLGDWTQGFELLQELQG